MLTAGFIATVFAARAAVLPGPELAAGAGAAEAGAGIGAAATGDAASGAGAAGAGTAGWAATAGAELAGAEAEADVDEVVELLDTVEAGLSDAGAGEAVGVAGTGEGADPAWVIGLAVIGLGVMGLVCSTAGAG